MASANGTHGMNWIRKDLRMAVYLRDGMACMWCGSGIEDGAQLTLDHVQPHSQGGANTPANLVCACHKCNSVRADRPAEEFAAATASYLNHGVDAGAILSGISEHTALPIAPYRAEAKAIIARRPSWQAALAAASRR
jgi:hypothetical protein